MEAKSSEHSDFFKATHPVIGMLEEAVANGQCADALRYIAANPSQATGDFIDLLLQVGENLSRYPEVEQGEIEAELYNAASTVNQYLKEARAHNGKH